MSRFQSLTVPSQLPLVISVPVPGANAIEEMAPWSGSVLSVWPEARSRMTIAPLNSPNANSDPVVEKPVENAGFESGNV